MSLKMVRLELARDPEYPTGSRERGYEFVAPLDPDGTLNVEEWRANRDRCRVKRFWPDQNWPIGRLVYTPDGSWIFDFDPNRSDDDVPGFKLDKRKIVPGEYISFRENDGELRAYFVVTVEELD
nr:MAG: hypothetical protein DIU57_21755 [Pseudomonadota bacterium]